MKNPEGNIGEVFFGKAAEKVFQDKADKKDQPMTKADRFVAIKMAENEIIPNYDEKTTYGQLFRKLKNGTSGQEMSEMSLPPEIDDALKFKEWFSPSVEDNPKLAA
jgi:hypothetical protein